MIELIVFLIIVNGILAVLAIVSAMNSFRYFKLKGLIIERYLQEETEPGTGQVAGCIFYRSSNFPILADLYAHVLKIEGKKPENDPVINERQTRAFP